MLTAVHPIFPLAPKPYLLSEELGFTFYVMERRRGIVIRGSNKPPQGVSESMVETLADLHAIDVSAHGLESLGKPAGFVARQIRGWTERWHGSKTTELPEMEQLAQWLEQRIPSDPQRPAVVHGDYKLDNVMLDASEPRKIVALFDWEMSAIGDPLVDVGIFLCYSVHVDGIFTRNEILDRYAAHTNQSLDNIALYEVFAVFKLAVVIQQIYARYVRGQTDDPRFANMGEQVAMLARKATAMI